MYKVTVWVGTLLVVPSMLSSCGGSGDSISTSSGDSTAMSVTSNVGNATIEKVFKPHVTQFGDSSVQQTAPATFRIDSPPVGFGLNSVFTWGDRPYVVTSVTSNNPLVVTVRDAQFDEVLSQLKVTGDITIDDANSSRMVVADASNSNQTPAVSISVIRSTTVKVGLCKMVDNDSTESGATTVSCTVNTQIQPGVSISGSVGIKGIKFSDVNLDKTGRGQSVSTFQATPYVTISGQISGKQNTTATLKGDILYARIRMPISLTLGFVSIGVPFYLSYSVPLYNSGISVTGSFPYTNGSFGYVGTLQVPTASVTTAAVFTAQLNDAFLGIKSGAELALTSTPTPLASAINVATGWPIKDDRLLAVGIFGTIGAYGSMSVNVTPPTTTACLKYALAPRVDTVVESSLFGDPIASLALTPLKILSGLQISGSTGCAGQVIINTVSCKPTSYAGGPAVDWQMSGTATGPVGSILSAAQGAYDQGQWSTTCTNWTAGKMPVLGGATSCQRSSTDPETTSWSSSNIGPPQGDYLFGVGYLQDSNGQLLSPITKTSVLPSCN